MTQFPSSHEDDAMRRLLHDAVDDVEPRDSLHEIRSRTRSQSTSRPWVWGVGGAVLASAATFAAIAMLGGTGGTTTAPDPGFAGSPAATATSEPTPTEEPSVTTAPPPAETVAVPVYYVGDTPQGVRLYREFQEARDAGSPASVAADRAVRVAPRDPDYRTDWPMGTRVSTVTVEGDVAVVNLEGPSVPEGDYTGLRERPAEMTQEQAAMAIEQVIYTVQAALQERLPVQFLINGERTDMVLGVPTAEPLAEGNVNETLSLVMVTTPESGAEVSGSFVAEGIANSFEATVPWELRQGDTVVLKGFATAEGAMDKLYPWRTDPIDVSDVDPGEYTFVAMTSDPSGGAEGNGPYVDSKQITVVE